MKKKILILAGGFSREREISLKTAKGVFKQIKRKYHAKICEPNGNLIRDLRSFKPDVVFNALHGRYGEDGYVQSLLESEKIKYTHSGVLSSSIAIDKEISKNIFVPITVGGGIRSIKDIKEISIINFYHQDVMRHPLVTKIVEAYQKNTNDKG